MSTKLPLCSSSRWKHSLCFIAGMLDVQQIFGRAGRPQYESSGLGVILTQHANLSHYLGMLTHQLPIESQFVSLLVDNLNAEIVLGEQQLSLPVAISQPPPSQPHVPPCRRMPVMGSIPNPSSSLADCMPLVLLRAVLYQHAHSRMCVLPAEAWFNGVTVH